LCVDRLGNCYWKMCGRRNGGGFIVVKRQCVVLGVLGKRVEFYRFIGD